MTESAPQGTYDDSFSAEDKIILDSVDAFHADGLALQKWWEETNAVDSYAQRFGGMVASVSIYIQKLSLL